MTDLAAKKCVPCESGTKPLPPETANALLAKLPGWALDEGKLTRSAKVANFQAALDLVNAIGAVAEAEGHHPDLLIHSWNRVKVTLYTHSIGGLSENDFILAAKIGPLLG